MDYKKASKLRNILFVMIIVLIFLMLFFKDTTVLLILFCAVILTLVVIGVVMCLYYRCPHCQAGLPFRAPIPTFCPSCGKRLE